MPKPVLVAAGAPKEKDGADPAAGNPKEEVVEVGAPKPPVPGNKELVVEDALGKVKADDEAGAPIS